MSGAGSSSERASYGRVLPIPCRPATEIVLSGRLTLIVGGRYEAHPLIVLKISKPNCPRAIACSGRSEYRVEYRREGAAEDLDISTPISEALSHRMASMIEDGACRAHRQIVSCAQ